MKSAAFLSVRDLFLVGVVSAFCLLLYVSLHQIERQNANDPQIALAYDTARLLANGKDPDLLLDLTDPIPIEESLSPYRVVFNDLGKVVASEATLWSEAPHLPQGVFEFTRIKGEDRFTWQPGPGVRSAVVLVHYSGAKGDGFVMAGRSLREVEKRIELLTLQFGLTWCALMLGFFSLLLLRHRR